MKSTDTMRHVLVLLPSVQDRSELLPLAELGYTFHFMDDPAWKSHEPALDAFDPHAYIGRCLAVAREVNAAGVFYTHELANFIAAVLARELGLPGPTVESIFLTNHKLYGRATEIDPISFKGYALGSDDWRGSVAFPAHVKPVSLFFSLLQSTVRNEMDLEKAVTALRGSIRSWERPFTDLFEHYVDTERFPLAAGSPILIEEFIGDVVSQHAVEGWSDADGVPHLWATSDNNYMTGRGAALDNNSVPSALDPELARRIEDLAFATVRRFGMKSGFWNVEVWVREGGKLQITEVNGRICATMTALYRRTYGKSQYPVILKLACGQSIDPAADAPGEPLCYSAMFGISTVRKGLVRQLIDIPEFHRLTARSEVIQARLMFDPDTNVTWHQTGGRSCIARAWIAGDSAYQVTGIANEIRASVANGA